MSKYPATDDVVPNTHLVSSASSRGGIVAAVIDRTTLLKFREGCLRIGLLFRASLQFALSLLLLGNDP